MENHLLGFTMTDYDKLRVLFDDSHESLGEADSEPQGKTGSRIWSFYLNSVERDTFEDADSLLDNIKELTGLEAQVLYSKKSFGDGDDQADDFTVMIGCVDEDPDKTWLVQIDVALPHVEDFDCSAEVSVWESRKDIDKVMSGHTEEALSDATAGVCGAIQEYAKGDPERVREIFDAIRADQDSGQWLREWEAGLMGKTLNETTPKAPGKRRPGI